MIPTKKTVLALLLCATPLTRATLHRAFQRTDFEVLWAANVSEAMEAGTRSHFDLLLLDLNQPLRAAWSSFERLAALNARAPVVLLTEHKTKFEKAVADKMGAVLQKPFSAAALTHTVNVLLGQAPVGAAQMETDSQSSPDAAASGEDFRAKLQQRYSAPFVVSASYRHWGINE